MSKLRCFQKEPPSPCQAVQRGVEDVCTVCGLVVARGGKQYRGELKVTLVYTAFGDLQHCIESLRQSFAYNRPNTISSGNMEVGCAVFAPTVELVK